jgi:Conjugative transposon protein TcpC
MARRATLDRGMPRSADDEALLADPAPQRSRRSAAKPRRGAGGRWVIWVLRGVAWLVLLLIGYRGVAAIVTGAPVTSNPAAGPPAAPSSAFPQTLAEAYALQFGSVYLNFSPATATSRSNLLASFMSSSADPELGWNGSGTQTLQNEQVASVQVLSAHTAVVTLLALVDNNHLIELGVPVYAADGGRMVVTGEPALLPAPGRAAAPQAVIGNSDQAVVIALQAQLPSFFRAYADGGQATLNRFLTSGAQVTGLGGAVTYGSIQSVTAPFGGATREVTVVVVWHVSSSAGGASSQRVATAPASLEMTYRMTVVRQGANWYVQSIGTSTQPSGPP